MRESGSTAKIYGIVESDDPGILNVAGKSSEGVVFATFSLGSEEFQKRFIKKFKEAPSRPALPAYDGVKLLLTLAGKVGTNPEALMKEFATIKNYPAENGVLAYTEDGERSGEKVQLMMIREGKAVEIAVR